MWYAYPRQGYTVPTLLMTSSFCPASLLWLKSACSPIRRAMLSKVFTTPAASSYTSTQEKPFKAMRKGMLGVSDRGAKLWVGYMRCNDLSDAPVASEALQNAPAASAQALGGVARPLQWPNYIVPLLRRLIQARSGGPPDASASAVPATRARPGKPADGYHFGNCTFPDLLLKP